MENMWCGLKTSFPDYEEVPFILVGHLYSPRLPVEVLNSANIFFVNVFAALLLLVILLETHVNKQPIRFLSFQPKK